MNQIKLECAKVILKYDTKKIFEMLALALLNIEELVMLVEKIKHISYNNFILNYLNPLGESKFNEILKLVYDDLELVKCWDSVKNLNDTTLIIRHFSRALMNNGICKTDETAVLVSILMTRTSSL